MTNHTVSSIQKDSAVDHDYGEGAPGGKSSTAVIRISALPKHVQRTASKLDLNGDGELDKHDIAHTMENLDLTKMKNKKLHRIVAAFAILSVLLIACIFGATITAARLSKDVNVNHTNGFAYVKGSTTEVMKTEDAVIYSNSMGVAEMPNGNLIVLKEVILAEGDVRFMVKGHARDMLTGNVLLLVEGGTLTYDSNGIVDASGVARTLLEAAFGSDAFDGEDWDDSEGRRRLDSGCGLAETVSSGCTSTGRYACT